MGKIFYVMGKSASGKDTIYKQLHARMPELKTVRMYTTRPIRDGETDGVEYFFVDDGRLEPVSYTHLDVYKRQLVGHIMVWKIGAPSVTPSCIAFTVSICSAKGP